MVGMSAESKKKSEGPKVQVIARNRRALYDYELEEKLECGIQLQGTEVKVLRAHHASLEEAWAEVADDELWLIGMNIPIYTAGSWTNHEEKRRRKLLAHKREIRKLAQRVNQKGKTIIPLEMYFDGNGRVKVVIAVGSGKREHDKRESIKQRETDLEIRRAMRR